MFERRIFLYKRPPYYSFKTLDIREETKCTIRHPLSKEHLQFETKKHRRLSSSPQCFTMQLTFFAPTTVFTIFPKAADMAAAAANNIIVALYRFLNGLFMSIYKSLFSTFANIVDLQILGNGGGRVSRPLSVNYHFLRTCNYSCGFCFHTAKTSYVLPIEKVRYY